MPQPTPSPAEAPYRPGGLEDPRPRSFLVVLGCRVGPLGLSPAARRRCVAAFQRWQQEPGAWVVVSGGKRWEGTSEADAMARFLVDEGVPSHCIIRESLSLNTFENAFYSSQILRHFGTLSLTLVTSSTHMPRALRAFQRQGLQPTPTTAASMTDDDRPSTRQQLFSLGAEALQRPLARLWAL